jgi:hypothetical protein
MKIADPCAGAARWAAPDKTAIAVTGVGCHRPRVARPAWAVRARVAPRPPPMSGGRAGRTGPTVPGEVRCVSPSTLASAYALTRRNAPARSRRSGSGCCAGSRSCLPPTARPARPAPNWRPCSPIPTNSSEAGRGARARAAADQAPAAARWKAMSQVPVSNRAGRPYERRLGSQRPPAQTMFHSGWHGGRPRRESNPNITRFADGALHPERREANERAPGWTRTSDHQVRNLALCPLSYKGKDLCAAGGSRTP